MKNLILIVSLLFSIHWGFSKSQPIISCLIDVSPKLQERYDYHSFAPEMIILMNYSNDKSFISSKLFNKDSYQVVYTEQKSVTKFKEDKIVIKSHGENKFRAVIDLTDPIKENNYRAKVVLYATLEPMLNNTGKKIKKLRFVDREAVCNIVE
ncbi:MAG: hypothetical protein H6621_01505 [Halobacteriovoraceae bacterium]|nr:hypothetical protein [Halobacteriovoraceae bacterium]